MPEKGDVRFSLTLPADLAEAIERWRESVREKIGLDTSRHEAVLALLRRALEQAT